MGKINSRSKGQRGEREVAEILTARGYTSKRGGQQGGGGSLDNPDVISALPWHIEVKRTESINLYNALDQAIRDAATATASAGKPPLVIHRRNGREWVAILRLDDFLNAIEKDQTT
jgi:Holliday junction resolvase